MNRSGKTFADENTTEEDARKEYRAIAERRVRLGLVLGTMGEKEGVQVTEQELQNALMNRMRQFPGQEKMVIDYYRKNPQRHDGTARPDLRAEGGRCDRRPRPRCPRRP